MRIGKFHRHHRGQAFAQIVAGGGLTVLEQVVTLGVIVHRPRQGGPEAGEMRAAVNVADIELEDQEEARVQ